MAKTFSLKDGKLLISTEAPGGVYTSSQLKLIADLGEQEGVVIKATEDQRLALFVTENKAQAITDQLKKHGLGIRHYQDGLHQPTTCVGKMCPEHDQDALQSALDITKALDQIQVDQRIKIGINGCAQCCVPTHTLDIAILGDNNGYRISLGGKNSQIPEMASFMAEGVPAAELPVLIKKVVELYNSLAQPEESLQDVMDRLGTQEFVKALVPYSQDAASTDAGFVSMDSEDQTMAQDDLSEPLLPGNDQLGNDQLENFENINESEIIGENEALADLSQAEDADLVDIDKLEETNASDLSQTQSIDELENIDSLEQLNTPGLDNDMEVDMSANVEEGPVDGEMSQESDPSTSDHMENLENVDAVVGGETDENELERQLDKDIEIEQKIPEPDIIENTQERDKTMKLIDQHQQTEQRVGKDQNADENFDFDNVEIDIDAVTSDLTAEGLVEDKIELMPEAGVDSDISHHQIAAMQAKEDAKNSTSTLRAITGDENSSNELCGVELNDQQLSLNFNSGMYLVVDLNQLAKGAKTLNINAQTIKISPITKGISVMVNGMQIFIPTNKMAA